MPPRLVASLILTVFLVVVGSGLGPLFSVGSFIRCPAHGRDCTCPVLCRETLAAPQSGKACHLDQKERKGCRLLSGCSNASRSGLALYDRLGPAVARKAFADVLDREGWVALKAEHRLDRRDTPDTPPPRLF